MTQKNILVIDDSKTIRTLVSRTLGEAGYFATTAEDGQAGLDTFPTKRFDAVITDINMPKVDGFGVMEGIRNGKVNKRVPILALTTEGSQDFRDRAKKLGATGWIVKPYEDQELITILDLITGGAT